MSKDCLLWAVGIGAVCLLLGRQKATYTSDDSGLDYTSYLRTVEEEPKELSVVDNVKKTLDKNPYIDAK